MSRPVVYIHIGPHKTGTTTIQQNLGKNRKLLAKMNYIFPATGQHTYGHHGLVGEIDVSNKNINKTRHLENLKSEVIGSGKHVILSSEGFSRIQDTASLETLRDAFQATYTVKIIPYLRRQDYLLPSLWKTELDFRAADNQFGIWLDSALKNYPNLHYQKLLGLYATVFGKENILPQIYRSKNPSHFSSFLQVCGIPDDKDFKHVENKRVSISDYQAKVFTTLFRAEVSDIEVSELTTRIQNSPKLFDLLKTKMANEKHISKQINVDLRKFLIRNKVDLSGSIFTRPELNKVLAIFKDSNRCVSREYFGVDTIFTENPPSDFIEQNFLRRFTKAQLVELCNLVFINYRREEMKLLEGHAA